MFQKSIKYAHPSDIIYLISKKGTVIETITATMMLLTFLIAPWWVSES